MSSETLFPRGPTNAKSSHPANIPPFYLRYPSRVNLDTRLKSLAPRAAELARRLPPHADGEVLVKLKPAVRVDSYISHRLMDGVQVMEQFRVPERMKDAFGGELVRLKLPEGVSTAEGIALLEDDEQIAYMSPAISCKFVNPKTGYQCNPDENGRQHDARDCWQPDNPKSSVSFTLRRFRAFGNFTEACGVLCKYSSDSSAFRDVWAKATQDDRDTVSLEDIRREFSEYPNLTARKNGESKVMIDPDGVTKTCGCGRFDAAREKEKLNEAFRECWIVKMIYTLLNESAKKNNSTASVTCMSEEDFHHDLMVLHAQ